ncbi:MAG: hypothetical protein AAF550_06740, partial [Myxococcota bacterium]
AGVAVNARVDRVVWGCDDPKAGALRSLYQIGTDSRLNHTFLQAGGVCADESAELLKSFFGRIRSKKQSAIAASAIPVTEHHRLK